MLLISIVAKASAAKVISYSIPAFKIKGMLI
jgi:hypothetical protein